jgi:dynein assembly factor with WDR repeat domains 1
MLIVSARAVLILPELVQVSSAHFNFRGDQILSGSIDMSARIWDTRRGSCMSIKRGHTDEVLDVAFNSSGSQFATASADGTARLYDSASGLLLHELCGHDGEVSKVYLPDYALTV